MVGWVIYYMVGWDLIFLPYILYFSCIIDGYGLGMVYMGMARPRLLYGYSPRILPAMDGTIRILLYL